MQTVTAIRHVAFEDLGSWAPVLTAHGFRVRYLDAGLHDLSRVDPFGPDLLVVLGGPIGATDEMDYPFLADELRLLARRIDAGRPTLGICLGAQLMARALGARIHPDAVREIGWTPLTLTDAGRSSCLAPLAGPGMAVLHWHSDSFELPHGAELLASTERCRNQAFAYGDHALGLQFHPEVTERGLEPWYIGHARTIAGDPELSPARLRAAASHHVPALQPAARSCLEHWLESTGLCRAAEDVAEPES